jgi:glycerophosphoryl diester phosphodiesterase
MSDAPHRFLIAHRGASAYAPEHTRAAYELAIQQGADYIEPDLAVTKDGALVVIHDDTLERTTNVEAVFPDRARGVETGQARGRRWFVADFTLAELRTLDAGAPFASRFVGERILTLDEVIDIADGRAGIVPELKSPALYRGRGVDPVELVANVFRRRGLERHDPSLPVLLQTFDVEAARGLAAALPLVPRVLLLDEGHDPSAFSDAGLTALRTFVTGIAPHRSLLDGQPDIVRRAHARDLTVVPWTFRATTSTRFPDVTAEMTYYLDELGVDGLFTDNPDLFPRPAQPAG